MRPFIALGAALRRLLCNLRPIETALAPSQLGEIALRPQADPEAKAEGQQPG